MKPNSIVSKARMKLKGLNVDFSISQNYSEGLNADLIYLKQSSQSFTYEKRGHYENIRYFNTFLYFCLHRFGLMYRA